VANGKRKFPNAAGNRTPVIPSVAVTRLNLGSCRPSYIRALQTPQQNRAPTTLRNKSRQIAVRHHGRVQVGNNNNNILLLLLGASGHCSPRTRVLRLKNLVRRYTVELPGRGIGQSEGLHLHKKCRHRSLSQVGLKLTISVPERCTTTALNAAATLTGK